MTIIESRRQFLKRLGYAVVGALIVPIPKIFYSFPAPQLEPWEIGFPDFKYRSIEWKAVSEQLSNQFALELEDALIFGNLNSEEQTIHTRGKYFI